MISTNPKKNLCLTLSQKQILDSSKSKEFADDNFKFDDNGTKFSKWVENTVGKEEIACYKQFLLFLQCFQKTCKNQGLYGTGLSYIYFVICKFLQFGPV